MTQQEIILNSIGQITNQNGLFQLEIHSNFRPALKELETFSHVIVIWWAHQADPEGLENELECKRPYKLSPESVGIFATRSPFRPNNIAITIVPVISIDSKQGVIQIPYIDAEVGTPLIDLKPYHPSIDRVRDAKVPDWCSHWPSYYEESADFDWENEFNF